MSDHTFLLVPATWRASGSYHQPDGSILPCRGATHVRHEEERWVIDGTLTIEDDEPTTFANTYVLRPIEPAAQVARYRSTNPDLGEASGVFAFVGDSILSTASVGDLTVLETLTRTSGGGYSSRGALIATEGSVGQWEMILERDA